MELSGLVRVLNAMRHDLAESGSVEARAKGSRVSPWEIRELSLEVGLKVVRGSDGQERVELIEGTPNSAPGDAPLGYHRLILKLAGPSASEGPSGAGPRKRVAVADSVIITDADGDAGTGGDEATLLRRLEIVLGGPPGFTTGAKAEILADLLREFGRAAVVENLQRVWVSQFDTGADASPSVTKG